jgi:ABC-2 type transport system ATP-binding protein
LFTITAENAGKKYGKEWIFRQFSCSFTQGSAYVITGPNGSGKSTLLQLLSGFLLPTEGKVAYSSSPSRTVNAENFYKQFSIAAPYMELMEELSLYEALRFHLRFKPFYPEITIEEALEISGLNSHKNKLLKKFSSGMKQRVKLILAILSDCPVLFLDEPLSNLDSNGAEWYAQLMQKYAGRKLCIVCSNKIKQEYFFCTEEISILDFK